MARGEAAAQSQGHALTARGLGRGPPPSGGAQPAEQSSPAQSPPTTPRETAKLLLAARTPLHTSVPAAAALGFPSESLALEEDSSSKGLQLHPRAAPLNCRSLGADRCPQVHPSTAQLRTQRQREGDCLRLQAGHFQEGRSPQGRNKAPAPSGPA